MRWSKVAAVLMASAALFSWSAGSAQSAPSLYDDFGRGVGEKAANVGKTTPLGQGWRAEQGGNTSKEKAEYLQYPAKGALNPEAGTLEVELIRDNRGDEEIPLTLADAEGETVLEMRIRWEEGKGRTPTLNLSGLWYVHHKSKQWGEWNDSALPMPSVGKGAKANIILTWGAENGVYVNGQRLEVLNVGTSKIVAEMSRVAWVNLGGQVRKEDGGVTSQTVSLIKYFYLFDQEINGGQLYANPESYHPSAQQLQIASVSHEANRVSGFSGKLINGDSIVVGIQGTPKATAVFDVVHYPEIGGTLEVDWRGWGVYLEDKAFFEENEVNLRDVEGYAVYGSAEPFDPASTAMEPVKELKTTEQRYTFTMLPVDTPYYVAVVAKMKDGTRKAVVKPIVGQAMTETTPGVYSGSYSVQWQDHYKRAVVVGRLISGDQSLAEVNRTTVEIDPTLTLTMKAEPAELKADEKSTSNVTVTVTDANGNPVAGHEVRFLVATTSQYTGVVGGGAFTEQVGGKITESTFAKTDLFGRVSATYIAGFAAKTAIVVARDMASNSTGAAYVKTFIQARAELELEPVVETAAMDAGYAIAVTSSDEWLTADGKSQARITARVTLNGKPVEGHKVSFSVTAGMGTIRTVKDTTDKNGDARAVYTAGKKIGIALVTATDTTVDLSGTVSIELRSDAPAKIAIKVSPEKIPADGRSRADLNVTVTDINDNPNENTEVEYSIVDGGGSLESEKGLTNRRGESSVAYQAGRTPGKVTFEITVRSTVPTADEMTKARGFALAPADYDFF